MAPAMAYALLYGLYKYLTHRSEFRILIIGLDKVMHRRMSRLGRCTDPPSLMVARAFGVVGGRDWDRAGQLGPAIREGLPAKSSAW